MFISLKSLRLISTVENVLAFSKHIYLQLLKQVDFFFINFPFFKGIALNPRDLFYSN